MMRKWAPDNGAGSGGLERSGGLTFPELLLEVNSRLPRNTTLVAIVQDVTEETAVLLGGLHRRGFRVTVVPIAFDSRESPDWAQGPDWAVVPALVKNQQR